MSEQGVSFVTGGNRGIGLELCRQLHARGYRVLLTARSETKGRAAAASLGVDFCRLDVSDETSSALLAEYAQRQYDHVDLLFNNAGVILPGDSNATLLKADYKLLRDTMEINTFGALRVVRALLPLLGNGSHVLNISSGMGALTDMESGWPAYRLSKTALNNLTRQLAMELADNGVRVNAVCPGWVRTELGGPNAPRSVEEGAASILKLALDGDAPTGCFYRDGQPIPW